MNRRVLFSPHSDDEALFAFYTVMRHRPRVVLCFPSERDYGDTVRRLCESRAAMRIAGVDDVAQWQAWGFEDLLAKMMAYDEAFDPIEVWAPTEQTSHPHHLVVARAAIEAFGSRVRTYQTYDHDGKVTAGIPVPYEPEWPSLKMDALACYRSQLEHPRARVFFSWDLAEYAGVGAH